MTAVESSREDFLDEIRIAPRWKLYQFYQDGFYELMVYYSFGQVCFRSPSTKYMSDSERSYFYKTLSEIVSTPSIVEVMVQ